MKVVKSNVMIKPNVMIDDEAHRHERHFLPGDLLIVMHPELKDRRVTGYVLTNQQLAEYYEQLVCLKCKRPCAGSC